jgi:hypothetical protein
VSRDIPAKKRQAQPVQLTGDGEMEYMNHQEERSDADWTLMVYVGATAVLDSFAVESLKQMKRAAGDGVIVAAQFDASGHDKICRLIFDGTGDLGGSIENNVVGDRFFPNYNKTPGDFLEEFILWAYKECPARHYCLVLWTDGSLSPPGSPMDKESREALDNSRRQNFLLPVELRATLEKVRETGRAKFDIIAMDACNMSMIEDVYELRDCAEFLIASEEEMPDHSMPYEQLLPLFREHKDDTLEICRAIAREYKRAYQDYISNRFTGLKKVTLSCLQLAHISKVTGPLDELALALLSAVEQDATRKAVITARDEAKSFIAGLFVDVCDFCDKLRNELTNQKVVNEELESACAKVCDAISTLDPQAQVVVGNETSEPDRCHGLSIYYPNLSAAEKAEIEQANGAKGGTDILNKSRAEGILGIETYYPTLQLAKKTHWNEFIAFGWSRCLIKETPLELDTRYSALLCAIYVDLYLSSVYPKPQTPPLDSYLIELVKTYRIELLRKASEHQRRGVIAAAA